jgi:hypothetical protein
VHSVRDLWEKVFVFIRYRLLAQKELFYEIIIVGIFGGLLMFFDEKVDFLVADFFRFLLHFDSEHPVVDAAARRFRGDLHVRPIA